MKVCCLVLVLVLFGAIANTQERYGNQSLTYNVSYIINALILNFFYSVRCPSGFNDIAQKCYKFHQSSMSWNHAMAECLKENSVLASVQTQQEKDDLLTHIDANCKDFEMNSRYFFSINSCYRWRPVLDLRSCHRLWMDVDWSRNQNEWCLVGIETLSF